MGMCWQLAITWRHVTGGTPVWRHHDVAAQYTGDVGVTQTPSGTVWCNSSASVRPSIRSSVCLSVYLSDCVCSLQRAVSSRIIALRIASLQDGVCQRMRTAASPVVTWRHRGKQCILPRHFLACFREFISFWRKQWYTSIFFLKKRIIMTLYRLRQTEQW